MRQTKKHLQRITAVLLSVVLVFSTFEGISFTGYAAEITGAGNIDAKTDTQKREKETDTSVPAMSTTEEEVQSSEEKAVETEAGTQEEPSSAEEKSSLAQEESSLQESTLEENTSEVSTTESEEETEESLMTKELRTDGEGDEAYTGTAETYEDGWRELIISESAFKDFYNSGTEKSFDDAAIVEILTGHAEDAEKFDSIKIEYNAAADHKTISQSLWNAAVEFGGRKEDTFYANFYYGTAEAYELRWYFKNPEKTEADVNIEVAKLEEQNAGEGVIISFANTTFPAEKAGLDTYTDTSRSGSKYEAWKTAFGECTELAAYKDTDKIEGVRGEYWTFSREDEETAEAGFCFEDVKCLDSAAEYILKKAVYKGVVWEDKERTGLDISYDQDMGKESVLTTDEVREILETYHTGKFYDEIYIVQPSSESNVIDKDMADMLYPYLRTDTKDCRLRFGFMGEDGVCTEWKLWNPHEKQDSDQTAAAGMTVADGKISVTIQKKPKFNAEKTELSFSVEKRESTKADDIIGILGSSEPDGSQIVFRSGDNSAADVCAWYNSNDESVRIDTDAVNEMTEGIPYDVENYVYAGDTWTWTDDSGEHIGLNINYRAAGKEEAFTAEEVRQILSGWGSERFDEIYLEQPYKNDSNVIEKAAADALYKYLKPKADKEERRLYFVFVNPETDSRMEWGLMNPQEEQEGDQNANAVMNISGDKVSLTMLKPVLKAERVSFGVGKEMTKDPDSAGLIKLFGEAECDLVFQADGEQDIYGNSWIDRNINMFWISPYDVSTIKDGKTYSVEKDCYLGDVTENEILISSFNRLYDQDRFTPAQLEEIVAYYRSQGRSFHSVIIQQRHVDSIPNIIDKDLYNYARRILDDTSDRRLSFGFCGCQDTDKNRLPVNWEKQEWDNQHKHMEYAEFGYYYLQDDFIWSFVNPTETDKDIDANVALKTEKNKGITIKLADNRPYKADDVSFSYYCDPQSITGTKLEAALGKPEDFGGDTSTDLFVLDKDTNTPDNRVSACYMTNEEWEDGYGNPPYNQNYSLYFNNVREWIPGREFWMTKMECFLETAEKEFQLPALPQGAQNPVWQSHNTDIAVIDADKLKQVDGNEGYVHFSVTYTLGGEEYQKAYRVYMVECVIPITKIQFNRKSFTMEVPPRDADWEALEYLEVKYYPANATIDMDQSNLKWTTSDNKVVTLVRDSSGRCGGEIKAVGAGTATIKAEYKEEIYAECEVTVEEPIVIEDDKWPEPYAVTNFDKKLADVAFPKDDNGEWRWKDPDTSLAPYADMEWHLFAAVYTRNADKKTMDAMVGVKMISVDGAEIVSASEGMNIPAALTKGERILLDVSLHVDNGDYADNIAGKYSDKIEIRWSSSPAEVLSAASGVDGISPQYFTAKEPAKKKIVKVSVLNKKTNKIIAKDSIAINVTNKPVMNFEQLKVTVDGVLQEDNQWIRLDKDAKAAGVIAFATDNPDNKTYTLTAKSSDTSVLQVKPNGSNQIAYTIKNYGKTQLTVTANDAVKSSWKIDVSVLDKKPQIIQSQLTINKAGADKSALLTIVYADGYRADGENAVTVDGTDFAFENGRLILRNTALKGTALAKIKIKSISDNGGGSFTAEKTIKVKLINKMPKVTLKQTKKVNAFYKNTAESHAGILTVNAGSAAVMDVRTDSPDFAIVSSDSNNVYGITIKDGRAASFTPKVKVKYTITDSKGAVFEGEKELKVSVENKAPALMLSAKTDTLYPRAGFDDSVLTLSDKATGRPLEQISVKYNNKVITNPVALNKNSYNIELEDDARIHFTLHNGQNNNYIKGTDKITLNVECAEWTKPVNVSYRMKVNVNEPKVKLSSVRLTLNKNGAAGIYQSAELTLSLAGRTTPFDGYVTFKGSDNVLNHAIVFNDRGEGRIGVRFNLSETELKGLEAGSYSFTLTAHKDGWANSASANLKVDVKDFAAAKCIKVSKKGSIDVLRRSQTYIAYTPKISNLTGSVIDGWITGTDAYLFDSEYDAKTGQLRVRAKQNGMEVWNYSTKGSYKITPVFRMETVDGYQYEIMAGGQVVKVKQGKPKITILSEYGNTLYREAGNGNLTFGIRAELSNDNIAIQDVTLANYRNDLNVIYDPETGMVTLSQFSMKEITKSAKTWGVKLAVRYADKAGNEKDAIVTYKVMIR